MGRKRQSEAVRPGEDEGFEGEAFETDSDAVAHARYRIRARGLDVAIDALISVASDHKSPAAARAQAASAILRAGGLFTEAESTDTVPHSELTPEQLHRATVRATKSLARLADDLGVEE